MKKFALVLMLAVAGFAVKAQQAAVTPNNVPAATPVLTIDAPTRTPAPADEAPAATEQAKPACCAQAAKDGKACCASKPAASQCSGSGSKAAAPQKSNPRRKD